MSVTMANVKSRGWNALVKSLGHAGATKFMMLYESGEGDYTVLRKKLFKGVTTDDILKELEKNRK